MFQDSQPCMKILKAFAILLGGPVFGSLVAFFFGALALPPDPNFSANGGHVAPGDGIASVAFIFVSVIISVPTSIFFAAKVLLKKNPPQDLPNIKIRQ
jgi:hypothetical protein